MRENVLLTAAHEFTHFIREHSPAQYEVLKEFVTERMLKDGRAFSAMVRAKMNQTVDGKKLTQDEAVEEVIADACEMVFSDSKSVEALRKKDKGLWSALKNWMHDFLADLQEAFTGVEARHESAKAMQDYISELAERFGVALAEASENAGAVEARGDAKYSYAGRKAKTADTLTFSEAERMEKAGKSSEDIRKATGWFRGMDGNWRFEINDRDMQVSTSGFFSNPDVIRFNELNDKFAMGTITEAEMQEVQELSAALKGVRKSPKYLNEYVKHDALFAAYPELAETELSFTNLEKGERGYYERNRNRIVLDNSLRSNETQLKNTLIHEIQHIVQHIEGFATGASVEYWKGRIAKGYTQERKAKDIAAADKAYRDLFDKAPEELKNKIREINRATLAKDWDKAEKLIHAVYESEYADQYSEIDLADFDRRMIREREYSFDPRDLYDKTAGEIEARDSAKRRELTDEQRKDTRPDVDKTDVVFADEGKSATAFLQESASGKKVTYDFGVTQEQIDSYVDKAYTKENTQDHVKYKKVSEKLREAVSDEFDLAGYVHVLRDNDIRHVRNSHGEQTNEKYPVTSSDQKLIPYIVENYDFVFAKYSANNEPGILYVKVTSENVVYYVEAVAKRSKNDLLLINKQMIKTGINEVPNLAGLNDAIQKKQTVSEFLSDLQKVREAYVQDVIHKQSAHGLNLSQQQPEVKPKFSTRDNEGNTLSEGQQRYFADSKVRNENGNLLVMYRGGSGEHTVFDRRKSKPSNLYGRGFYFTNSKSHAQQYGNATVYYLDIKHPLSTDGHEITRAQMRKFIEYIENDGEDYDLYNYGENATVDSVLRSVWSKSKSDFQMIQDINATVFGDLVAATELFNQINGTDFDGFVLPTETVTFRSEQAKRTDNQNPTSNPDIRFSTRDSSAGLTKEEAREQARAYTKLKARNAKLEKQVKELKRELSKNPGKRVEPKDVAALAKDLVRQYASNADTDRVEALIQELGDRFVGDPALDYDGMLEMAQEVAYTILSESIAYEDTRQQLGEPDKIRDKIKTLDLQVSRELLAEMPEGFRKRYSGKLHLVVDKNEGVSIRGAYGFLQQEFGTEFFPEANTDAERLSFIAEMYDRAVAKPTAYNPYESHMNESVNHLALDIVNAVLTDQLEQSPPSAMEKVTTELQKTKAALEKQKKDSSARIREIRAEEAAKRKELREELTAEKWKKVKAVRAYYLEQKKRATARRKESAAQQKYRARVFEQSAALMDILTKSDTKNIRKRIPVELQTPILEFLQSIDYSSKRLSEGGNETQRDAQFAQKLANAAASVKANVETVNKSGFSDIRPEFLTELDAIVDKVRNGNLTLQTMTGEELKALAETLKELRHYVTTANVLINNELYDDLLTAGSDTIAELKKLGKARDRGTTTASLHGFMQWWNMKPAYVFERFGKVGKSLWKEWTQGQGRQAQLMDEAERFAARTWTGQQVQKWRGDVRTFKLKSGETIRMPVSTVMSLYNLWQRDRATVHLLMGQTRVGNFTEKGKIREGTPVKLEAEDLIMIFDKALPEGSAARRVAEAMMTYLSNDVAAWGNEIDVKRFGVPRFTEKKYWPMQVDSTELSTVAQERSRNQTLYTLLNQGFMKPLSEESTEGLVLMDAFDVFAAHVDGMIRYASYALPLLDTLKWYNYKSEIGDSVKNQLRVAFGTDGNPF